MLLCSQCSLRNEFKGSLPPSPPRYLHTKPATITRREEDPPSRIATAADQLTVVVLVNGLHSWSQVRRILRQATTVL